LLEVTANPAGLTAGQYEAAVTLAVPNGPSLQIPVIMTVVGFQGNKALVVSTGSLVLSGLVGGSPLSSTVSLGTFPSGTTHEYTAHASSGTGWLSVTPFTGLAPTQLQITANPALVPGPGTYDGTVLVTSLLTGQQEGVFVRLNVAARAITVDPTSLTFNQTVRGLAPPAQTVQIRANTPSNYTVSGQPSWVRISSTSGSTPGSLTVNVDPTGLPPGSHTGNVRITGPDNQLTIPVTLNIPEPPAPTATPSSLAFTYVLGSPAPASQTFAVGSTTAESIPFSAAVKTESGIEWLVVTPSSGATPATLTASIVAARVVPGQHKASITITAADPVARPAIVDVTLNVSSSGIAVQTVLHAGTLAPTPVAPGLIVTLTGTGLGPATAVVAKPTAAGAYETRLSDVRVLFDDVPAPLLYVQSGQINAIVPYSIYGRATTRIQVESGSSYSVPVELRVVDSVPGIFSLESGGRGQGAIVNSDGTINSSTNASVRGSVISVYATGEGQTDPQGQDGRVIVTDLRRPLLKVTAKIGGLPAEVLYAGSAPQQVSGMLQVNLRIPVDVEPGSVPIEIQVGTAASQQGVTVAVR